MGHIFFITHWYPSPLRPVQGIFIAEHARAIAQNHSVSVAHIQGLRSKSESPAAYSHDPEFPIDVYHIIIRPTGATLVERGINTETGWGTARYWPAEVRVAPARQSRAWTVEVSIPLNAFDPADRSSKRWAINFGRFQPRLGEYSSWSGARRYLYNTRSFGNLQWP